MVDQNGPIRIKNLDTSSGLDVRVRYPIFGRRNSDTPLLPPVSFIERLHISLQCTTAN